MYRASVRRKSSAVSLCKSIESAIQWFQIHHGISFVTIHNPAVYLSGARVSISPTLVPRLTMRKQVTKSTNLSFLGGRHIRVIKLKRVSNDQELLQSPSKSKWEIT